MACCIGQTWRAFRGSRAWPALLAQAAAGQSRCGSSSPAARMRMLLLHLRCALSWHSMSVWLFLQGMDAQSRGLEV